ncbi:hypothetical protein [Chryseobacterium scophthalmum]|uniref:hypothetical protein n=2 Tax=Chryseobacterium TaxID=59732 RepID=UPI000C9DDA38|nr:hypothetical protein [Chryseobacterium scophthalmum]
MRKELFIFLIALSSFLEAQTHSFGNLQYKLSKSGIVKNIDQMQSITFGNKSQNIIMINKIPNVNLPNFKNLEYKTDSIKDLFLKNQIVFIDEILKIKNSDIEKSNLLMNPHFLFNGKIYFMTYSIKNIIESNNRRQMIIEFYFMIPHFNESYLIVVSSFDQDSNFALELEKLMNSLTLK